MPFNPFVWNNTQPSPQQFISTGQTTILNNFQFLGSLNGVNVPGWIQFPNGLIMQWGLTGALTAAGNDTAVPLLFTGMGMQAFTNNCFTVQLTMITASPSSKGVFSVDSNTVPTKNGFTIRISNSYPSGMYVYAIGN